MNKIVLIIFLLVPFLYSQETLQPYHWANEYINYMIVKGHLDELNRNHRPFNRREVARALLEVDDLNAIHGEERAILKELMIEFSNEFSLLVAYEGSKWERLAEEVNNFLKGHIGRSEKGVHIKPGVFLRGGAAIQDENSDGYMAINPNIAMYFTPNFTAYWNFKVFNQADSNYIGKKFSGLYAYNQQAYLQYDNDWMKIKMGRDWLQLGPGRSGQLLFSDNSRTFDQYYVQIGKSALQLHFWGVMLDRRRNVEPELLLRGQNSNRYINGHRLTYSYKNQFRFGLNEIVLYGGPDVYWELPYMNPMTSYHAYMLNRNGRDGNILYSVDWDLYFNRWEFYGEFLIDDMQIEEKTEIDLEPDQWGLISGIQWIDPFDWNGSILNAEYIHIRHRVYNSPNYNWEKLLHRNMVIGYLMESNMDRYYLRMDKWWGGKIRGGLSASYMRTGEGSVAGEFNKDYLESPAGRGYSEPFPFGVVEKHLQMGFSFFYRPIKYGNIQLDLAYNDFSNYLNVDGRDHQEWTGRIELWLEWNGLFKLD